MNSTNESKTPENTILGGGSSHVTNHVFWHFKAFMTKPLSLSFALLILSILTFALYAITLGHGFVFDDSGAVVGNASVHKGFAGIPEIFMNLSWENTKGSALLANFLIYRPLSYSFFAIQYQFFGNSPMPFHLVNVLVYAGLVCVMYLFLNRLTEQKHAYWSLLVALLYALHPVHTEVVCNIKSQDELFAMFWGLLSLNLFMKSQQEATPKYLWLSVIAFGAAAFSKENGLFWFPLIALTAYVGLKKSIAKSLMACWPYLIPAALFLILRHLAIADTKAVYNYSGYDNPISFATSMSQELGMRFWAWGTAIWQLVFPYKLKIFYHYNDVPMTEVYDWQSIVSLLIVVFLVITASIGLYKRYWAAFGVAAFGLQYAIFMQIPSPIANIFGERWLFTPSFGFCILIGSLIYGTACWIAERKALNPALNLNFTSLYALVAVLCMGYSVRTFYRSLDWQSEYKLFTKECEESPNTYIAHRNASIACNNKMRKENDPKLLDQYIFHLERCIDIRPELGTTYETMGKLELERNNLEEAAKNFELHLKYGGGGDINSSKLNLARCRNVLNIKFEETANMLNQMQKNKLPKMPQIQTFHEFGIALKNLAIIKKDTALYDSAYVQFNRARMADEKEKTKETDVYMSFIFKDMGDCEMALKLYTRAEQTYYHAINLNANNYEAYLGVSEALKVQGKDQLSKAFYFKYLQLTGQKLPEGLF
ncbi:MAG: hypothetical protein EAZ57_09365 [Cytophagales bacterium]|nr:MAG: hypothetical protein EAZ67_10170 [Cytophagales bacterium]TAF59975.1 MAG: hypothetical protein EAZ57_09365 [Cytophagales bacterium]